MSKTDLTPSCPICNGKIFRNLWAVQGLFWRDISERALERESISFELGQCQVCAHIMILDEYTPQILKRLYSSLPTRSPDHFGDALSWIKELPAISNPVVVDFGCGSFNLLKQIRHLFPGKKTSLIGVDFNQLSASVVPPGIELIESDLHYLKATPRLSKLRFHIGLFTSVLEHVLRPREVLEGIASLMADNGSLYVELPVVDNINRSTGFSYELVSPQHIHYFTAENLTVLFKQCGFAVAKHEVGLYHDFPRARFTLTKPDFDKPVSYLKHYVDNNRKTHITAAENIVNLLKAGKSVVIWGVSSDVYWMTTYNSELLDAIRSCAIRLVDSVLKGSEWLGSVILDPQDLEGEPDLIIALCSKLRSVRASILRDAMSLGFGQNDLLDPFEEMFPNETLRGFKGSRPALAQAPASGPGSQGFE